MANLISVVQGQIYCLYVVRPTSEVHQTCLDVERIVRHVHLKSQELVQAHKVNIPDSQIHKGKNQEVMLEEKKKHSQDPHVHK